MDADDEQKRESFTGGLGQCRWHVALNGEMRGPLSDFELVWLAGNGMLKPEHLVWRAGYLNWIPASGIAGLLVPPELPNSAQHPAEAPPPAAVAVAEDGSAAQPEASSTGRITPVAASGASETMPVLATVTVSEEALPATAGDGSEESQRLRALLLAIGAPSQPAVSYATRHWRGELSLGQSFWISGMLITLPVVALCALMIFAAAGDGAPFIASTGLGWLWPLAGRVLLLPAIALQIWCIVGIFRSACRRDGVIGEVATATAVCSGLCCAVFTLIMLRG